MMYFIFFKNKPKFPSAGIVLYNNRVNRVYKRRVFTEEISVSGKRYEQYELLDTQTICVNSLGFVNMENCSILCFL